MKIFKKPILRKDSILGKLFHGDKILKKKLAAEKNDEAVIDWSIYGQGKSEKAGDLKKRMYSVHVNLKGRVLYPILYLLKRFLKKHYKEIPPTIHNQNMLIFDKAFEKSILDWHTKALRYAYKNPVTETEEEWIKRSEKGAGDLLRTAKQTILLIANTDTAYRNFLDILMYNIASEMNKTYKDKPVHHLLYNSASVSDVHYYTLHRCLKTGEIQIIKPNQLSCCEIQAIKDAAELIAADAKGAFMDKIKEAINKGETIPPDKFLIIQAFEKMDSTQDLKTDKPKE